MSDIQDGFQDELQKMMVNAYKDGFKKGVEAAQDAYSTANNVLERLKEES